MAALREASALWVTRVVRRRVGSESPSLRAICRGGDVELATCRKKATEKEIGSYSTYCDTVIEMSMPGKVDFYLSVDLYSYSQCKCLPLHVPTPLAIPVLPSLSRVGPKFS